MFWSLFVLVAERIENHLGSGRGDGMRTEEEIREKIRELVDQSFMDCRGNWPQIKVLWWVLET